MALICNVTPYVSVEGDGVTISGETTGGDAATCTKVGYRGSDEDSADEASANFEPGPGRYTAYASFLYGGSTQEATGHEFVVSAASS